MGVNRPATAALLAAGLALPAPAIAQSVEELQIQQWKEIWEQGAWTPRTTMKVNHKGGRAQAIVFGCTIFEPGTVALTIQRKASSPHPVKAYRGATEGYCAPRGVGIVEFADGGRWLGEVTNRYSRWTEHMLPYPNGLGELRKADGSTQILRVRSPEKGPYGWEVVQVIASSTAKTGDVNRPVAWLTRPAPADWARLRPATGEGRVVLNCAIAGAGGIDCGIAESATPELDAAALSLSRLYKVDMAAEKDRIGYSFKLPFRFDPPTTPEN